jgi:myxalamid-type polyketide synthase MxaE and MxaD
MVHNGYEWPIICVTQGSISTSEQDPLISPDQASLRGFLRTVKQEYNQITTGLVDLSPDSVPTGKQLLAAVNSIVLGEGDIAIRKGQFWVERMLEIPATPSADNLLYTNSQTIVLTGGLGSLAFILAHWLIDRGARSFVLIGRREPNSDQEKQINLRVPWMNIVKSLIR